MNDQKTVFLNGSYQNIHQNIWINLNKRDENWIFGGTEYHSATTYNYWGASKFRLSSETISQSLAPDYVCAPFSTQAEWYHRSDTKTLTNDGNYSVSNILPYTAPNGTTYAYTEADMRNLFKDRIYYVGGVIWQADEPYVTADTTMSHSNYTWNRTTKFCNFSQIAENEIVFKLIKDQFGFGGTFKTGLPLVITDNDGKLQLKGTLDYDSYIILYKATSNDLTWGGKRTGATDNSSWKVAANKYSAGNITINDIDVKKNEKWFIVVQPVSATYAELKDIELMLTKET